MRANEIDAKVKKLRELRSPEAEIRSAIADVEEFLKTAILLKNTDVLNRQGYKVMWKTAVSSRFDPMAFQLPHANLFRQYSKSVTGRQLVIAQGGIAYEGNRG